MLFKTRSFFYFLFLYSLALPSFSSGSLLACHQLLPRLPNVGKAVCEAAELKDSGARSVQGRPIWVSDLTPARAQLKILVVGGIHGDEMSATSLVMHWIAQAQREQAIQGHEAVTQWRFIPVLNPDGLLAKRPTRVNARGVDLNRNFPTPNWARETRIYWEQRVKKDPRRYPGPRALSEPESRFLHAEIERMKPDLVVSVHAPYGVLDFDGPHQPPSRLGRLYLDQVGVFPGSLGNYSGIHKGVPVVTIELASALKTPREVEMRQMWRELRQWMRKTLVQPGEAEPTRPPVSSGLPALVPPSPQSGDDSQ
jgi:protein MpaA